MTAKIYTLSPMTLDDLPTVPNLSMLVITLRHYHWDKLDANQRSIVLRVEVDLMGGDEKKCQLKYLHKLYLSLT